jgi:hypothetical protein
LLIDVVIKYYIYTPLGVLPLLWPLFPLIAKVGAFKRGMEDNYNKVIQALKLYFIKILIKLLQSYINTKFNKGIIFVLKALLSSYKDLTKKFYIYN